MYAIQWVLKHAVDIVCSYFTYDLSRYTCICLMNHESEVLKCSRNFIVKLKIVVTRGWNIYDMIVEMNIWVASFGTQLRQCGSCFAIHATKNTMVWWCHSRDLFDMVHTMMSLIELPLSFMGYALETTAFTLNRASRNSVEMTQYRLRFREI